MTSFRALAACLAGIAATTGSAGAAPVAREQVYLDAGGVIRWRADDREVALFGANYCLPSSSDYRAAGYVGADRKKLIDQDVVHFARMGWDGLRLALWGDWENCDREGNLIVNDHLDLFDYLLFRAKERGISMLFTPIHRHTSLWPDGRDSDAIQGFSKHYPATELGTNPAAIRAQQNYLRQILNHVNPYTGVALKDEPAILFIEMINEPEHHAADFEGSVSYINALVDAVRDTGCKKLLFHNLSQDFRMARPIAASKVDGYSFGWYPTNLVARRTLEGNYLRWVDRYSPLPRPETAKMPSIVYEFDSADMLAGYMYPAMVRAFRGAGAQFAAMFAYDMLATAPYNLGWQTHYLNLVYSPRKAVSAIIAAEAMRTLPRGLGYGEYPANRRFGAFRVEYERDLSEMATADVFLHCNATDTRPPQPEKLRRIAGVGSSPLVEYDGLGAYFLDRISDGNWRLEVYPDAVVVQDPFAQRLNYRTPSIRLVERTWPMRIALPDLGEDFDATALDAGNSHEPAVRDRRFGVRPGVYLLARKGASAPPALDRIGGVGLREFVCPTPPELPLQAISRAPGSFVVGRPLTIDIDIVAAEPPRAASLRVRQAGATEWRRVPLKAVTGYTFRASLPGDAFVAGPIEFAAEIETDTTLRVPAEADPPWRALLVSPRAPLPLLDPRRDALRVFTLRVSGDQGGAHVRQIPASGEEPAALRFSYPAPGQAAFHAFSLAVAHPVAERGDTLDAARALRIRQRGTAAQLEISLVETDGTTWTASVAPTAGWQTLEVPLDAFRLGQGLKLPLGYPGHWNRDLSPAANRGGAGDRMRPPAIQHLQFKSSGSPPSPAGDSAESRRVDLAAVELVFD